MAKDSSVRAIKDDADYLLDIDFNRIQQDEFNLGVFDGADESFLGFWKHLGEYCIEKTCRQEQNRSPESLMEDCSTGEGDDDDNGNDDDNDPQYELVLNNLIQYGKAYSLQAENEDGTIMHIRYEEQEGVIDEPRRKGPGRPRGSPNKAKNDLGSSKSQFATRNFDVGETAALRSSPRFSKYSSSRKERDTELATTNFILRDNNAPRSSPRISEDSSRKRKQPEFPTTNSNVRGKITPSSSPRISENTLPRRDAEFAIRNSNVREKIAPRFHPRVSENASRKEKHTSLATRNSDSKEKITPRFSPRLAENASRKGRDTELATRNSSFRQKDAPRFSPRIAENLSRKERDNVVNNHQAPNVYNSSRRNSQQASKAAQMSDYVYFLNNLKVLGGSPVFVYKDKMVRYEEESSDSEMGPVADPPCHDVGRRPTPKAGKDFSSDPEIGAAADPTIPCNTGRQPTPKTGIYCSSDPRITGPANLATPCNTRRRPTPKTAKDCSPDPKIGAAACPATPCNTGRQPTPEAGKEHSSDPKVGAAADPATPCNTGKQATPEVGKDCSCDPKIGPTADPAMACDSGRQPTPKVDSKKFNYPDAKVWKRQHSHRSAQSSFRSLVISELKKPYNQAEMESFKAEAYRQRPIERHRESRSAISKSVKVDQLGKSYIDLYPELGEKIKAAKGDPRRTLSLLRGFFFWLQCLTKDGAFYPWEDPDCLEVLPESN